MVGLGFCRRKDKEKMDRIIEVHDREEGYPFLLNSHYIKLVRQTEEGCAIRMDDLEERYKKAMEELKGLRT